MPDSYWPEAPGDVSGPESPCELTVLMPCLNEAETLAICIKKAQGYMARHGIPTNYIDFHGSGCRRQKEIRRAHP